MIDLSIIEIAGATSAEAKTALAHSIPNIADKFLSLQLVCTEETSLTTAIGAVGRSICPW